MVTLIATSFSNPESSYTPIEKIYTQTDRPFYFPGETIWFKSYLTDTNNLPSTLSEFMYADLISPKGSVIKTLKLSIQQGASYGDFDIQENWIGGIYTLKMYTQWMRNFDENIFFTKKITVQKIVEPTLLLNLKFQKEGYGKSSKVIADFEVKNLKNNPLSNKEITFEVTVKGQKISSEQIKTDGEGKAKPSFILPATLATTDVVLNVLIPYRGSTESISRSVPVVLDTMDVQFFPESGKIIAGTTNTIAFKAINEFGKPADISGIITDDQGNFISDFVSYHDGMGGFTLNAIANTVYYAQIKEPFVSERKITLPTVYTKGVTFSTKTTTDATVIKLFSTLPSSLRLEISDASKILYTQKIEAHTKQVTIPSGDFPKGITKLTLYDKNNVIAAERLVFMNPEKKIHIEVSLDKEIYQTREKVKLTVKTTDMTNTPIPSNLSISIADNKLLSFADDKQDHIESYLFMSSELKGKIHKPVFYFDKNEPKASKALDYVMLTHGWRNYIHSDKINIDNATFKPEQKEIQIVKVIDKNGKPTAAHLYVFDDTGNQVLLLDPTENGIFKFKINKANSYTLVAFSEVHEKVQIIVDNANINYYPDLRRKREVETMVPDMPLRLMDIQRGIQQKVELKEIASIPLIGDNTELEETIVIGYGTTKKSALTGSISKIASNEIESFPKKNITSALQGRIAGLQITGDEEPSKDSKILIRGVGSISGDNQPLFIIDGVPVQETLGNVNPENIHLITVLKDASATAIYGYSGRNGVILITTKNGKSNFNNWNKKTLNSARFNNYDVVTYFRSATAPTTYYAREFYAPLYESKELPAERTDFRKTIYWNPIVQTDAQGTATLEFYNSDAITSFRITAEGIGWNGLVGRTTKDYSTKKLLNLDFKIPNYLTLHDTVVLPLTIRNESSKSIQTTLKLTLPESIKLVGTIDSIVNIKASSSVIKNIAVIPVSKDKKTIIQASATSEEYSDTLKKEATILSPYFPTEVSISGSHNQSFEFDINQVVHNTLTGEFNIYTDIIGDVMNGIESLLRHPSGCFEQVSSSTYPNILILKYLKETGKSNVEIESKALEFIKEGYKKLAAYETSEHGFEWYGNTPPHEALSAYGLLEFTEMKDVYEGVDQQMLQRTINWLLSRRNGKGGFNQNRGKYGFSAAPEVVNNAYIVYAISESGIDTDIQKEYDATYQEALQSNDTYRMALLALASYKLNKSKNATRLLDRIKQNIREYSFEKLPVAETITRSYGNAKSIETTAFTLLALMKEENSNEAIITQGIEYILSKRNGGRFGSTQSTSMALKALIAYTKNHKRKFIDSDNTVALMINGNTLERSLKINDSGKIIISDVAQYLKHGHQKVAVAFSNPEITFPYSFHIQWDSKVPDSSKECRLDLKTKIPNTTYKVGDNVSLTIEVTNITKEGVPMPTAIIGIPSGATPQPWQLKEFIEQEKVAYYEIFDNYLVFYWREFGPSETKTLRLDLKADIAGTYKAPASTVYLYYADEFKKWISGSTLRIEK
ncbi:hypothetical protein GCM10022393_24870 [Aquimarina addita]|uniref:Alpha-2-macroglobulin domain-containing protein n=2 Tax=Aquimarina addita TaxID=870485 RepID=A0ABP6UL93_9FLAO